MQLIGIASLSAQVAPSTCHEDASRSSKALDCSRLPSSVPECGRVRSTTSPARLRGAALYGTLRARLAAAYSPMPLGAGAGGCHTMPRRPAAIRPGPARPGGRVQSTSRVRSTRVDYMRVRENPRTVSGPGVPVRATRRPRPRPRPRRPRPGWRRPP